MTSFSSGSSSYSLHSTDSSATISSRSEVQSYSESNTSTSISRSTCGSSKFEELKSSTSTDNTTASTFLNFNLYTLHYSSSEEDEGPSMH